MTSNPAAGAFLRILAPGLFTLIVDEGRTNWRSLGVPVGGAADRWSLALGNALVGNEPDAAALEITLAGPTVEATAPLACVVFGAPFDISGSQPARRVGTTFTLDPGEKLAVGGTARGMRAYLCVRGGLFTPTVLASRTGWEPLAAGAEVPCQPGATAGRFLRAPFAWNAEPHRLRALDGPQAGWFDPGPFYTQEFLVTGAVNRMGLRLQGEPLAVPDRELLSEPVCPGSVQVTRDGQCIILGVDGQTIGGYPKIAQVIGADLDKLGQLRPGAPVRFERVNLQEAQALHRLNRTGLQEWLVRLRTAEELHPPRIPGGI